MRQKAEEERAQWVERELKLQTVKEEVDQQMRQLEEQLASARKETEQVAGQCLEWNPGVWSVKLELYLG